MTDAFAAIEGKLDALSAVEGISGLTGWIQARKAPASAARAPTRSSRRSTPCSRARARARADPQIHDAIDNGTTTPRPRARASTRSWPTGRPRSGRPRAVGDPDRLGRADQEPARGVLQRSLDYDRDLQDGVAAYQSGDFERYIAKVFDDAGRSNQAATKAKRAVPGAYNELRASRGSAPVGDDFYRAPPRSDRRRAARRRPAAGCGRERAPATQTRGAVGHRDAPRRASSEAERNAERDLEGAQDNAAGGDAARPPPRARPPAAARPTAARPAIVQRPIPFGAKRREEMRAYARRHYGIDSFRLRDPKVIVEHYTVTDSFQPAYDTFANDVPDVELHELPGTCAHFVVDKDGTIYQLVALSHVPPHGRPQPDRHRDRAGRAQRARDPRSARPARRHRAPDRVAALPRGHRAARRDRPQREPVEPVPPRGRRRPAPPDPRRLDARRDAPVRARVGRYRCPA